MENFIVGLMAFYFFYIIALGLWMFKLRYRAAKNGTLDPKYFKDYQKEIPRDIKVAENHYHNQFQMPLLFYMACITGLILKKVTLIFCILAGVFVITRLIHSYVHLGRNKVLRRAFWFFIGGFIVGFMWISLLV